jgi:hypothetical protein
MADWSLDFDAARFVPFGSRQEQREEPIAIFGLDAIRIDFDRERERARKLSSASNGSVNVLIMLHPTLRCVRANNNQPLSAFAPWRIDLGCSLALSRGSA